MDITQKDRDSLREKQHMLAQSFCIGNIVEHKIQDPAKYKKLSRQEQGLSVDAQPEFPKISYKSKYLDCKPSPKNPSVDHESDTQAQSAYLRFPEMADLLQDTQWLNMDRVEFDKLEWLSDHADQVYQEKLKSTTHFDRDGRVVIPGKPGDIDRSDEAHDLESLIKLLDSTFQPHITYSLNVISKIATRATTGFYDAVFDENIHQILIRDCLLRIRHLIDSSTETICLGALKCLRSLICNTQVDEIFLDKMCPLEQNEFDATIWLCKDRDEFDYELKDDECVQIDAILALITRTGLLTRLFYLLTLKVRVNSKFEQAYQDCILDIIIRISRHSKGACCMLNRHKFPEILIGVLLPSTIVSESRLTQSLAMRTLKFLRILSFAAAELKFLAHGDDSLQIDLPEAIERTVMDYYHIDCYNSTLKNDDLIFRLHIETLRLMKNLMALQKFKRLMFNIMTMDPALLITNLKLLSKLDSTKEIESPSSLDWQYAASLIDLIGHMTGYEKYNVKSQMMESRWTSYVEPISMQWWTDLVRNQLIPHQDVSIAIASAIQHFDRCTVDLLGLQEIKLNQSPEEICFSTVNYYKKLIAHVSSSSCLDNMLKTNGCLRDPIMLPSYGFLNLNTCDKYQFSINKVAGIKTPFVLLKVLVDSLKKDKSTYKAIIESHANRNLTLYLEDSTRYYNKPINYEASVQQSLLAQQEVCLLSQSLVMLVDYYTEHSLDDLDEGNPDKSDSAEVKDGSLECYSNIFLDTISIIGLINPRSERLAGLKDKLIEKVILDSESQSLLHKQSSMSNEVRHQQYKFINILDQKKHHNPGHSLLGFNDLHIIKPIYMNCEDLGRFWIFQPIIEYYKANLKGDQPTRSGYGDEKGKWFADNMAEGTTEFYRDVCEDFDVIGAVLRLNAALMLCSPAYLDIAVKQNIEELICLVGLVFLDSELFLNQHISQALRENLKMMLSRLGIDGLFKDASHKIHTLNLTLADFFNKLIDQYEASSYGDVNFSNFMLLFIAPKSDPMFRKKLFSEKLDTCLSQMRLSHNEVWLPEEILDPSLEENSEIKTLIKLSGPYLVETSFLKSYRNNCIRSWKDRA